MVTINELSRQVKKLSKQIGSVSTTLSGDTAPADDLGNVGDTYTQVNPDGSVTMWVKTSVGFLPTWQIVNQFNPAWVDWFLVPLPFAGNLNSIQFPIQSQYRILDATTVQHRANFTILNNGNGSGYLRLQLPFLPAAGWRFAGRGYCNYGLLKVTLGEVPANLNYLTLQLYDGSYPIPQGAPQSNPCDFRFFIEYQTDFLQL